MTRYGEALFFVPLLLSVHHVVCLQTRRLFGLFGSVVQFSNSHVYQLCAASRFIFLRRVSERRRCPRDWRQRLCWVYHRELNKTSYLSFYSTNWRRHAQYHPGRDVKPSRCNFFFCYRSTCGRVDQARGPREERTSQQRAILHSVTFFFLFSFSGLAGLIAIPTWNPRKEVGEVRVW